MSHNEGVVLAETDHIRDAILAAEPTDTLAAVCHGDLQSKAFNYLDGGFNGSDLLNISTALFEHRRRFTHIPPTGRPVELGDSQPRSFIGKTIMDLLDVMPDEEIPDGALSFHRPGPMETDHFCNEAEEYFLDCSSRRLHVEVLAIDAFRKSRFYIKKRAARTLLTQGTTFVNGVSIPAGVICAVNYAEELVTPTDHSRTDVLPLSGIYQIAPLRVSIFGVPYEERTETFFTPEDIARIRQTGPAGHLIRIKDYIERCPSMSTFNQEVTEHLDERTFDASGFNLVQHAPSA